MIDFLNEKQIRYTHLRFFNKENKRWASAQLNAIADFEDIVTSDKFWPEGVFFKSWLPWEAFLNSKRDMNDDPRYSY